MQRPVHHEQPLAAVPAANILENEQVPLDAQLAEEFFGIRPVHAIRCALHDDRQRGRLVLGHAEAGIELRPIAHRNALHAAGVAGGVGGLRVGGGRGEREESGEGSNEESNNGGGAGTRGHEP